MEEIDGESAEQGAAINLRRNSEQSLDDSVEIIEENITTIDLTTAAPTPSSLHLYDADDVFARALPAITTTTTTTTTLMQQQPSAISSVDGSNISSSIDIQQYIHSILTNSAVNSNTSNDIQQYIPTFPNSAAEYTALQIKCEKPSTSTQALKDIGSSSAEASAAATAAAAAAAAILLDNQQPSGSASSGPSTSTSTPVVLECPICLQTCIHPARLPCGHIFCFLCVKGVAYKNRRCAMCRREIPAEFLDHPQLVNGIEDICSTKATEDGYQWFYEGRNGWWQYDDRTSQDLEEAFKKAERSCTILVAGYVYIVDFDAMLQQRQNEPARCRRVKRDLATIPKKGVAGLRIEGNTVTTDTNFAAQINQSRQMRYRGAADLDPESEDDTTSPPFISLRSLMPYSSPYGGLTGYEIELGNPSEFVSTAAATDAALRIASDIIGSTLAHADELSRSTSAANNLSNSLFQRRSNRIPNVDINPSINSNNAAISTATPAQTPETGNTDALALISPPFNRLRSTTAAAAAETQNMFSSLPPTPNPAAITAPASAGLMATAGVRERGSLLGAAEDLLGATQRVIASADQPTIDLFEQTLNDFHALTLGRSLISNYNNDDDDGEGEGDGEVEGDNDVSDIAEHSAQNARSSSEETSAREANDGQPLDNAAETHARNNDAESNAAHTSASNVKSSNHNNS